MVAEPAMLRGSMQAAANAAAVEDAIATATTAVATVAATGEVITLGVTACRRRLQRVRGDEGETAVVMWKPRSDSRAERSTWYEYQVSIPAWCCSSDDTKRQLGRQSSQASGFQ